MPTRPNGLMKVHRNSVLLNLSFGMCWQAGDHAFFCVLHHDFAGVAPTTRQPELPDKVGVMHAFTRRGPLNFQGNLLNVTKDDFIQDP